MTAKVREGGWSRSTWEGARNEALLEGARLSLREKLRWLESAHLLAERIQRSRRTRSARASGAASDR